jgi:hypothetical protein
VWRLSGTTTIEKERGFDSLFFPLHIESGELRVAGHVLEPVNYMRFTSPQTLSAQLDCLIVLAPEAR